MNILGLIDDHDIRSLKKSIYTIAGLILAVRVFDLHFPPEGWRKAMGAAGGAVLSSDGLALALVALQAVLFLFLALRAPIIAATLDDSTFVKRVAMMSPEEREAYALLASQVSHLKMLGSEVRPLLDEVIEKSGRVAQGLRGLKVDLDDRYIVTGDLAKQILEMLPGQTREHLVIDGGSMVSIFPPADDDSRHPSEEQHLAQLGRHYLNKIEPLRDDLQTMANARMSWRPDDPVTSAEPLSDRMLSLRDNAKEGINLTRELEAKLDLKGLKMALDLGVHQRREKAARMDGWLTWAGHYVVPLAVAAASMWIGWFDPELSWPGLSYPASPPAP